MEIRLKVFKIIIVILFILMIARAGQLQLVLGNYYYQLSEGNRISLRPINAPRGKIIDSSGHILVSNRLSYNLYLLQNEIPPSFKVVEVLNNLSELTRLEFEEIIASYESKTGQPRSSAILLKRNISPETMVIIRENSDLLPGILVKESSIRDYVYDSLAAHILGYVGEIGVDDLQEYTAQGYDYRGGDIIGITGLEREYEFFLNGKDGIEQIEVNSLGQKVKTIGTKPPNPGNNLVLNIDLDLQQNVEKLLTEQFKALQEQARKDPELGRPTGASAVVMDPNTGAIRAMVSVPGYNLNHFAEGFSGMDYQKLLTDPLNPLLPRPIKAAVPPGSIFKLITGTAAIEHLGVTADTMFYDSTGQFFVPNWSRPYRNWHEGGEKELDFTKAIARSNNVVFYDLGYQLYKKYGGKKLTSYAREYGLGTRTGIDLPGEKAGLVPDEEWKRANFNQGWYPGDSVNLSIGQGGLLTTPIQLIDMVSAIANEGILYKPYLVDKIVDVDGNVVEEKEPEIRAVLPFEKRVYQILKKGMLEVANASYGTASDVFKDFPVTVAGKTGTAQTWASGANHGWFVGFAPYDDPQISVLVFLESGSSSAYTLPIAADIFRQYFGISEEVEEVDESETTLTEEDVVNDAAPEKKENNGNQLVDFFKEVFSSND